MSLLWVVMIFGFGWVFCLMVLGVGFMVRFRLFCFVLGVEFVVGGEEFFKINCFCFGFFGEFNFFFGVDWFLIGGIVVLGNGFWFMGRGLILVGIFCKILVCCLLVNFFFKFCNFFLRVFNCFWRLLMRVFNCLMCWVRLVCFCCNFFFFRLVIWCMGMFKIVFFCWREMFNCFWSWILVVVLLVVKWRILISVFKFFKLISKLVNNFRWWWFFFNLFLYCCSRVFFWNWRNFWRICCRDICMGWLLISVRKIMLKLFCKGVMW